MPRQKTKYTMCICGHYRSYHMYEADGPGRKCTCGKCPGFVSRQLKREADYKARMKRKIKETKESMKQ
jgi:hypothetical protein